MNVNLYWYVQNQMHIHQKQSIITHQTHLDIISNAMLPYAAIQFAQYNDRNITQTDMMAKDDE